MEIYILNAELKREYVLDVFDSFIWTERFIGWGDFQVVVTPTRTWKSRLRIGNFLATSNSDVIMEIESTYITEDESGVQKMTVKGRSQEKFLEQYVVYPNWLGYDKTEDIETTYYASGRVDDVIVQMITDQMLIENHGNPNAIIPNLQIINQVNISETIEIQERPTNTVYDSIKSLCDTYDIGLLVEYRKGQEKDLVVLLTRGVDRPKVVYSSTLDNLAQESYLNDVSGMKNICYAQSKEKGLNGRTVPVYAYGASYDTKGLDRKEVWLETDIEAVKYTEPRLTNLLTHLGKKELAKHRKKFIFDGVITRYNQFTFGVHYFLGDTIYIVDELGNKAKKIVSEYITAWDDEGLRSYPTFVSNIEGV